MTSPEKYAVKLNVGAAYAAEDPISAASFVYSHPDLQNIPEVSLILSGAAMFQNQAIKEKQYKLALKKYNALSKEEKGSAEKPK